MSTMLVMFDAIVLVFSYLLSSAHAIPVLVTRDVVNPPVTSPDASTVWHVGETQTVTWDTSSLPPPANITNTRGKVILGFLTSDSENLMIDTPLAQNFSILDGLVQVTVPDVPPRTNYIIALMGDSGNISPEFTIEGGSGSASSSAAPSSSSTVVPTSAPATTFDSSPTPGPSSTPDNSFTILTTDPVSPTVGPSSASHQSAPAPTPSSSARPTSTVTVPATSPASTLDPSTSGVGALSSTNAAWSSKEFKSSSFAITAFLAFALL
ncbi:unnamed protein product [Somion occarium]|uniref:Yeast cell wall synthesis Kre9/Knh1-like N-terminal domain-containing protein n=1 Tax=Somion occarium TaxID=3059160 RepID=A0ABP1DY70_9APHY